MAAAWFDNNYDAINNTMVIGTCDAHGECPVTITTGKLPEEMTIACSNHVGVHRYVDVRVAPELFVLNNDKRPPLKMIKPAVHGWEELQQALHDNDLGDVGAEEDPQANSIHEHGPETPGNSGTVAYSESPANSRAASRASSRASSRAASRGRGTPRATSHLASRAPSHAPSHAPSRATSHAPSIVSEHENVGGETTKQLTAAIEELDLQTGKSGSGHRPGKAVKQSRNSGSSIHMELDAAIVTDSGSATPSGSEPLEVSTDVVGEAQSFRAIVVWVANSPKTRYFIRVTAAALKHLGVMLLRYGFTLGVNYPRLVLAWGQGDAIGFVDALRPVLTLCWKDGLLDAVFGKRVSDTLGVLLVSEVSINQLQVITDAITGTPDRGIGVPGPNPAHAAKQRHAANAARARRALEEADARVRDSCA